MSFYLLGRLGRLNAPNVYKKINNCCDLPICLEQLISNPPYQRGRKCCLDTKSGSFTSGSRTRGSCEQNSLSVWYEKKLLYVPIGGHPQIFGRGCGVSPQKKNSLRRGSNPRPCDYFTPKVIYKSRMLCQLSYGSKIRLPHANTSLI